MPGGYVQLWGKRGRGWGTVMINYIYHALLITHYCCKHAKSFSSSYLGIFLENQLAMEMCPSPTPTFVLG